MRRWRDMAAPDDPEAWYDVNNMWPTRRQTYETADLSSSSTAQTGTSPSAVLYAFAYGKGTTIQEYVVVKDGVSSTIVYSWDGSSFTSRYSGTVMSRGAVSMLRFGDVTVLAARNTIAGVAQKIQAAANFTSSFSDAGSSAPTGKDIICTQSNAVLAFASNSNTWAASDVGDYSTWNAGEAASGTLYMRQGNVSAAVAYGNDVFAFKSGSILRGTYVGGTVKWQWQVAWDGQGVPDRATLSTTDQATQDWAVATAHGIAFYGGGGFIYLFDGSSAPKCLNPDTTIPVEAIRGVFSYDPVEDRLCIAPGNGSSNVGTAVTESAGSAYVSLYYYYSFGFDAWGNGAGSTAELYGGATGAAQSGPVRGNYYSRFEQSTKPGIWIVTTPGLSGTITRAAPISPTSGTSCYAQTSKIGRADGKTTFNRCIPLLRRRTDLGSDSASCALDLYVERADVSARVSRSISESTLRKRFDLLGGESVDTFGRIKVTWTDLDVELDDFLIKSSFVQDGD